ncbi:hypothetical protein [Pseudonocardia sp. DLS-67]
MADIVAEQQNNAAAQAEQRALEAEQLAAQAGKIAALPGATANLIKTAADLAAAATEARRTATQAALVAAKPVTQAPATYAQSGAEAVCSGPGCTAATTADTSGTPGTSHTDGMCVGGSSGCSVASNATVTQAGNAGTAADGTPIPGRAATAETTSTAQCADENCRATLRGGAEVTAAAGGARTRSTAAGDTRCDGPCIAQIQAGTTLTTSPLNAPDDQQFATSSAFAAATCENGSADGCATRAGSNTRATGSSTVTATADAYCVTTGACRAGTGGTIAPDLADVMAGCTGTGCTTRTSGDATAPAVGGTNTATAHSACTASTDGECAGTSRVAAAQDYALAAAACAATPGSACAFGYRAESHAGAADAAADAVGYQDGAVGGGQVITSALAQSGPEWAQSAASCQATEGTTCSYRYEATKSAAASDAATGSYATAHAHGSDSGTVGGGAVVVTASASAQGNTAQATATCVGAPNCSSSFYAEAHDSAEAFLPPTETEWGGIQSAHRMGACSGSNGGCGVTAIAVPGMAGGGESYCFGDCSRFVQDGSTDFTPTVAPYGVQEDPTAQPGTDKNGNPIPPMGEEVVVAEGKTVYEHVPVRDYDGDLKPGATRPDAVGVEVRVEDHGQEQKRTCPTTQVCSAGGSGPRAGYNPSAPKGSQFEVSVPVSPGSSQRHAATGETGARLGQDAAGNTQATTWGSAGSVTDGRTGVRLSYNQDAPNTLRIIDRPRLPFEGTIKGQVTDFRGPVVDLPPAIAATAPAGPRFDELTTSGTWVKLSGNGAGQALISFDKGNFTSAEGDILTHGDGRIAIATRDATGYNGSVTINGTGTFTSAEGGGLACWNCEQGVSYLPTEPGVGGVNTCRVSTGGSSCTGTGPAYNGGQDIQVATVEHGKTGAAEFVQYMRNADGSGGGAAMFVSGAGHARGTEVNGGWIETLDKPGKRGASLLYAVRDADGTYYNRGQSCSATEACAGSDPLDRRLRWIDPTPEVTEALGMTAPGDPETGSGLLRDRGTAVFAYTRDQSHLRWMAETGNDRLGPVADKIRAAMADGLSLAEVHDLAGEVDKLPAHTMDRALGTDAALDTVLAVNGTRPQTIESIERQLAEQPELVATLNPEYTYDPDVDPSNGQIETARNNLLKRQDDAARAQQKLEQVQPQRDALDARAQTNAQAYQDYLDGKRTDFDAIEAEAEAIDAGYDALAAQEQPIRDEIAAALDGLRAYDAAAAAAAGQDDYASAITGADRNLDALRGLDNALRELKPQLSTDQDYADAQTVLGFADGVAAGYDASIEAPRTPRNRLHDMRLPSTGSYDLALGLRAAAGWDYFTGLRDDPNTPLVGPGGRDLTDDELSNLAATWIPMNDRELAGAAGFSGRTPARVVAGYAATPQAMQDAIALVAGPAGDPQRPGRIEDFFSRANVVNGSYPELAASLPARERDKLDAFAEDVDPKSVLGFFDFAFDGSQQMTAAAVRSYDRAFGFGTDNSWRNTGRTLVGLGSAVLGAPGIAAGGIVDATNSIREITTGEVASPRRPGERWADYYARNHPLVGGGMVVPVANTVDRANNGMLLSAYVEDPLGTFLNDAAIPAIALGGAKGFADRSASAAATRAATGFTPETFLPRSSVLAQRSGLPAAFRVVGLGVRAVSAAASRGLEAVGRRPGTIVGRYGHGKARSEGFGAQQIGPSGSRGDQPAVVAPSVSTLPESVAGRQRVDGAGDTGGHRADSMFDQLVAENDAIRAAPYTEGANRSIRNKWPNRTITTGRASGVVNGRPFDRRIAVTSGEERLLKGTGGEDLSVLPANGHLIFKTREFDGAPRKFDSEPKAFEELAREILKVASGRSRQAVENAIVDAIERAPKTRNGYPEDVIGDGYPEDAKAVIEDAAARLGVDLDGIDITVDLVIDYPRGRREKTPDDQICGSCQPLLNAFRQAFRGKVAIRARNPDGETLWED